MKKNDNVIKCNAYDWFWDYQQISTSSNIYPSLRICYMYPIQNDDRNYCRSKLSEWFKIAEQVPDNNWLKAFSVEYFVSLLFANFSYLFDSFLNFVQYSWSNCACSKVYQLKLLIVLRLIFIYELLILNDLRC